MKGKIRLVAKEEKTSYEKISFGKIFMRLRTSFSSVKFLVQVTFKFP